MAGQGSTTPHPLEPLPGPCLASSRDAPKNFSEIPTCSRCGAAKVQQYRRGVRKGWKCRRCQNGRRKRGWHLVHAARNRARALGVLCTIKPSDVVVPAVCPVLGIPLCKGPNGGHDASPTLDRLDPDLGYTPENVRVISMRANRIKNNATPAELRAVADWAEREAA